MNKLNTKKTFSTIEKFFNKKNSLVRSISAMAIGIIIIFFFKFIEKNFVLIIGAALLAYTAFDLLRTFLPHHSKDSKEEAVAGEGKSGDTGTEEEVEIETEEQETGNLKKGQGFMDIIKRIDIADYIYFIIGLVFLIIPEKITGALMIIFAVLLIILSCLQLKACIPYLKVVNAIHPALKWTCIAVPIVMIIVSAIIIVDPFKTTAGQALYTGIVMLIFGIIETTRAILFKQLQDEVDDDDIKLLEASEKNDK